jgi:release factor glutamine methyltransferase
LKKIIKYTVSKTAKPFIAKYLSKERKFAYKEITLLIPPQVFHPAFFFSTKVLLKYILQLNLKHRKFLELGAGSGLIAFTAAKKGAMVTATDINKIAVEYLQKNNKLNHLETEIIHSDLFENIPAQSFDIIAINPPYYKRDPQTETEYAWYCGVHLEYFVKLFDELKNFMHPQTFVLMILSEDCDIKQIEQLANNKGFVFELVKQQRVIWEMNYIFKIKVV